MRYLFLVALLSGIAFAQTVTCTPVGSAISCDNGVTVRSVGNSITFTNPIPQPVIETSFLAHPVAPSILMPQVLWVVPVHPKVKPAKARIAKQDKAYFRCLEKARTFDDRMKCPLK